MYDIGLPSVGRVLAPQAGCPSGLPALSGAEEKIGQERHASKGGLWGRRAVSPPPLGAARGIGAVPGGKTGGSFFPAGPATSSGRDEIGPYLFDFRPCDQ